MAIVGSLKLHGRDAKEDWIREYEWFNSGAPCIDQGKLVRTKPQRRGEEEF